jgi:hypothetical protein
MKRTIKKISGADGKVRDQLNALYLHQTPAPLPPLLLHVVRVLIPRLPLLEFRLVLAPVPALATPPCQQVPRGLC